MKRKTVFSLFFFVSVLSTVSSQNQSSKIKFLKGNISDKTAAVRESSGEDSQWLSTKAIDYALEVKDILENDRDLDALAVAGILTISNENVSSYNSTQKEELSAKLLNLFNKFNTSNTVQIAVLSKITLLKDIIPTKNFTKLLNEYISNINISQADSGTLKAVINTLGFIGNNNTFSTLYSLWNKSEYSNYYEYIENTLSALVPISMDEVLYVINSKNIVQIEKIFNLITKNSNISQNSLCEIAENVLNTSTILVTTTSDNLQKVVVKLQLDSLKILNENKWTRASSSAISLFETSKQELKASAISEDDFILIINSLANIAPIAAITPLTSYLEELNSNKEKELPVSEKTITAVISTLGAIGDKSAFDSLLAVTYLSYSESVLTEARKALSGLKW